MGLMQSPVGAVMLDTELRIVWVNEAAERLIGGPPAAGWAGRWLGEVLPGMDAGVIERSLRRVLATGEPVFGLEVSGRGGDVPGGERFWSCLQFRIGGPDGEAPGWPACCRRSPSGPAINSGSRWRMRRARG